jgi:dihydroxyacetone kinase
MYLEITKVGAGLRRESAPQPDSQYVLAAASVAEAVAPGASPRESAAKETFVKAVAKAVAEEKEELARLAVKAEMEKHAVADTHDQVLRLRSRSLLPNTTQYSLP